MVVEQPLFILAGNGPYENLGCEAIVRGTIKILREHYRDPRFICMSIFQSDGQFQEQCQQESDPAISHLSARTLSKKRIIRNFWKPEIWEGAGRYILDRKSYASWIFKDLSPHLGEAAAILSIGGDNYSLDYGLPTQFIGLDNFVLARDRPLAIWGASVGPFNAIPDYEKFMGDHLRKITGIFARESATIEYLEKIGVVDNIYPVADPAFLMDPVKPEGIEDIGIEENAIGLNLSPLMAKFVTRGDLEAWAKLAASLISGISQATELPIYLIPHVTTSSSDDHAFLQRAASLIQGKRESITVLPSNFSAAEIKWIIGRMACFAGARTHATIAALSSGVPTLSFAYSIKAKGINLDIFGHNRYSLDPSDLQPETVSKKITSIMNDEVGIREELGDRIPVIQRMALQAGDGLKKIIETKTNG